MLDFVGANECGVGFCGSESIGNEGMQELRPRGAAGKKLQVNCIETRKFCISVLVWMFMGGRGREKLCIGSSRRVLLFSQLCLFVGEGEWSFVQPAKLTRKRRIRNLVHYNEETLVRVEAFVQVVGAVLEEGQGLPGRVWVMGLAEEFLECRPWVGSFSASPISLRETNSENISCVCEKGNIVF